MSQEGETQHVADPSKGRRRIQRRLAAILAADVRGYSILMAGNEEQTHRRIGATIERFVRKDREVPWSCLFDRGRWADGGVPERR